MTCASPGNSGSSPRHEQVQEKGRACTPVPGQGGEAIHPFSVFTSCLMQIYGNCKHIAGFKEAVGVVLAPKLCDKKAGRREGWS